VVVQHHRRGRESAQHVKPGDALCRCSHLMPPAKVVGDCWRINAIPLFGNRRGD
jgi:hypothetical protein